MVLVLNAIGLQGIGVHRFVAEKMPDLRRLGATVATGRFGADMAVALVNDGPVTLLLEV